MAPDIEMNPPGYHLVAGSVHDRSVDCMNTSFLFGDGPIKLAQKPKSQNETAEKLWQLLQVVIFAGFQRGFYLFDDLVEAERLFDKAVSAIFLIVGKGLC